MVKRLSVSLIASLFVALLLPSIIEPYPCFLEPCTTGHVICFVEIERCKEYQRNPDGTRPPLPAVNLQPLLDQFYALDPLG